MPYTGKVSNAGISVDTNNDGIPDGRAMTVKNGGNFTTFSLTNGVLTMQPASAGATAAGSDTQVQFNDGSAFGGHSGLVYDKTADSNGGQLTVNKLVVSGDLTVSGTTTTVNTATLDIADNIITLNSDLGSGVAPTQNAGILINRGSSDDVELIWDETNDRWDFDTYALGSVGKVFASGSGAVYTFTSDTDTGVEHTGTNQLGLLVGNTRVLMVNANGVHIDPTGASGAGSNQALLVDNISIDTNTIASTNTNGNIVIAPNGTGDVQLDADTVRVGDSGADATITTNGAGDLVLNTNEGTNTGSITIEDGANNDILIIPDGTGKVGVGQTTPTAKLHVNGDATISGNLTVSGTTTSVSTTNTTVADALITLNQGETGNGITGNIAGFEVDRGEDTGNDNPIARFVFDDADDKFKTQLESGSDTGTYNAAGLVASTIEGTTGTFSGDLAVDTNVLKVDTTNNRVGVNITSPTVALDVSGDSKITGDLDVTGTDTIVTIEDTSIAQGSLSNGMPGLQLTSGGMNNTTNKFGMGVKFMSTDGQFTTENPKFLAAIIPRATETYTADADGGMALDFAVTEVNPGTTNVPDVRMTIHEDGVGIGTESPTAELHVRGASNPEIRVQEDSQDGYTTLIGFADNYGAMRVVNSTSNESTILDLEPVSTGTGAQTLRIFRSANSSGTARFQILSPGSNTEKFRFQADTGVLTHYGAATFNENGDSADFRVEGDTDTHLLFVDGSADKVGISTSSPVATLDVDSGKTFRATRLLTATITTSDTASEADHAGRYVIVSGSGTVVTLPSTHAAGVHFTFLASAAFTLRTGTSGSTGDNMNGAQSDIAVSQYDGVTCISDGTDWFVLGA